MSGIRVSSRSAEIALKKSERAIEKFVEDVKARLKSLGIEERRWPPRQR